MTRFAVVGNATRDVIRTSAGSVRRPGGTLLYAALALAALGHEVVPIGHAPPRAYAWLRRSGVATDRVHPAVPGTQFLNRYAGEVREQWARRGPPRALERGESLEGFDAVLLGPVLGEVPAWTEVPAGPPSLLDIQGTVRRLGPRNMWGWRPVEVTADDIRLPSARAVHASLDEARLITGAESPEDTAEALASRTGTPVLVTMGSGGALAFDGEASTWVRPRPVETADPTGAGDVFDAGYLAAAAEGAAFEDRVRYGCATAAAFLTKPWTRAPLERFATPEEVEAALEEVA